MMKGVPLLAHVALVFMDRKMPSRSHSIPPQDLSSYPQAQAVGGLHFVRGCLRTMLHPHVGRIIWKKGPVRIFIRVFVLLVYYLLLFVIRA